MDLIDLIMIFILLKPLTLIELFLCIINYNIEYQYLFIDAFNFLFNNKLLWKVYINNKIDFYIYPSSEAVKYITEIFKVLPSDEKTKILNILYKITKKNSI